MSVHWKLSALPAAVPEREDAADWMLDLISSRQSSPKTAEQLPLSLAVFILAFISVIPITHPVYGRLGSERFCNGLYIVYRMSVTPVYPVVGSRYLRRL